MTASLFRLYRAAGSLVAAAARGPDDGWFVAAPNGTAVIVARLNSARQEVWQRQFDLDDSANDYLHIASSPDRSTFAVAVGSLSIVTFDPTIEVALFQSDGTLLWHRVLALSAPATVAPLVVTAAGDVLVSGKAIGNETMLMKLAAANGATSWSVRVNSTASSATTHVLDGLDVLSTGDPVIVFRDAQNSPVLTNGLSTTHVQRLSGSDGVITWTRWLSWPNSMSDAESAASIGVDPSDNIYVCGARYTASSRSAAPVLKLAADGSTVWSRSVETPASLGSRALVLACLPRNISASAAGALIPFAPCNDPVESNIAVGFVHVASAGTAGVGAAPVVELVLQRAGIGGAQPTSTPGAGAAGVYAAADNAGASEFAVVFTSSELATHDQTFGPYVRQTHAFDLVSGTSTSTTRSFTRAAAPSISNDPGTTGTTTSTTLLIEAYPGGVQLPATPSTAHGTPSVATTTGQATGSSSTAHGTPVSGRRCDVASAGPTTAHGTPVQTWNRTCAAESTAPTTAHGFAIALLDLPTALPPGRVTNISVSTAAGEPTATSVLAVAVTSMAASTAAGTPNSTVRLDATSSAPTTAAGTPSSGFRGRASGSRATAHGSHGLSSFGQCTGTLHARAGTPSATARIVCAASGVSTTSSGSHASAYAFRIRSSYYRTSFGLPTTERTVP